VIHKFTERLFANSSTPGFITLDVWVREGIRVNALEPILYQLKLPVRSLSSKMDLKTRLKYPDFDLWLKRCIPLKYHLEETVNLLHSGDLLLFSGGESFSRLIKKFTWCAFSHSALIVKDPRKAVRDLYKLPDNERVFVFESDSVTVDNRKGGGVQMVPLGEWLKIGLEDCKQDGRCMIRPMRNGEERMDVQDWDGGLAPLERFMLEVHGSGYEKHVMQLIASIRKLNKEEDLSTIFCSELVAAAWMALGWLSVATPSNNYTPADFTSDKSAYMALLRGYTLRKEMRFFYSTANMGENDKAFLLAPTPPPSRT